MAKKKDPIRKNSRWVTGPWCKQSRYVTILKVENDQVSFRFDDNDKESVCSRTAFSRIYIPYLEKV